MWLLSLSLLYLDFSISKLIKTKVVMHCVGVVNFVERNMSTCTSLGALKSYSPHL